MRRAKVLLADSSSFCLEVEKWFLKGSPVSIFTAEDGPAVLELARKLRPNLIYLAYELPILDGASCCRVIKGDPALGSTAVVMVSAANEEEMEVCREAGCDALLVKPLDRRHFLEVGRAHLSRIDRRDLRIPCRLTVACRLRGKGFYGTIEDISSEGMFVGTSTPVEAGETLEMKFLLPGSGNPLVEAEGRVAWVNGAKRGRKRHLPAGFGVEFLRLDKEAGEQVEEFIERSLLRQDAPDDWWRVPLLPEQQRFPLPSPFFAGRELSGDPARDGGARGKGAPPPEPNDKLPTKGRRAMDKKMEQVAAALGNNKELVDKLEQLLREPGDRAYVVCEYLDCRHNEKGRCTVYMVTNPPERRGNGPCASYSV